jgi:phenylalanyl-tRNA synthetase beta chain
LFEIGSTFWRGADGASAAVVDERRRLGIVGAGDLRDVRGVVESVLSRLDAARGVAVVPSRHNGFARATCGRIEWGGKTIGHLGIVDRSIVDKLSLREAPAAAELEVAPLLAGAQHVPQLRALPRFPAVRRDLSLIVSEQTRYQQIESLVRDLKLEHLEDVEYVTTYRGKQLEKQKKSVTITLVFRSPTTTLTSEQVEASVQKVVNAARQRLSAALRT